MGQVTSFASGESIQRWIDRSDELSDDAYQAMKDTAALVGEIKESSAGSLVDELINVSNGALKAAEQVSNTMHAISDTVTNVVSKVSNVVSEVGGVISKIAGIFG